MGQSSSFAASAVHLALRRLRQSEIEDEDKVLRACGFCRSGSAAGKTGDEEPAATGGGSSGAGSSSAVPPPPSFGPLVSLDSMLYSLDELRAAIPFLPEAFYFINLSRFSLLYVLDADGDGCFSEADISSFIDWAVATLPPTVSSDNLNDALQAYCALECFQRCKWHEEQQQQQQQHQQPEGGQSSMKDDEGDDEEVDEDEALFGGGMARGSPYPLPTSASASPPSSPSPSSPASSPVGAAPAATAAAAAAVRTPSPAILHFTRWYLHLLHIQETGRQRDTAIQRVRHHFLRARKEQHHLPPSAALEAASSGSAYEEAVDSLLLLSSDLPSDDDDGNHGSSKKKKRATAKHFSLYALEELYYDFAVRDIYDLSFWGFAHLLDHRAAKRVEVALGLQGSDAMQKIRTASTLEELRHAASLEVGAAVHGGGEHEDDEDAGVLQASNESTRHSMLPLVSASSFVPVPITDLTTSFTSYTAAEECDVSFYRLPRSILLPFVICFTSSYWAMLHELRPDLFSES